jgi:hypothetical protein
MSITRITWASALSGPLVQGRRSFVEFSRSQTLPCAAGGIPDTFLTRSCCHQTSVSALTDGLSQIILHQKRKDEIHR